MRSERCLDDIIYSSGNGRASVMKRLSISSNARKRALDEMLNVLISDEDTDTFIIQDRELQ